MADLRHTSKKELADRITHLQHNLFDQEQLRKTDQGRIEQQARDLKDWEEVADKLRTRTNDAHTAIANHIAEKQKLNETLDSTIAERDKYFKLWRVTSEQVMHYRRERDQARAALQGLALSNGRLTEHLESRTLTVGATDECTGR